MRVSTLAAASALTSFAQAVGELPASPIRGVNLGGLFICEPWMMSQEWSKMGCGAYQSEFDCMSHVNAQAAFEEHWDTWITQSDIQAIASHGLNTVRIPVGYWIVESTVDTASEPFAKGGFKYLDRLIGWVNEAGLNAIIDLHGAPGAQTTDAFTGQYNTNPGFFDQYNYNRAYAWATNITNTIYSNEAWRNAVFAIEAVNEPRRGNDADMVSNYYPNFLKTVRGVESQYGVSCTSTSRIMGRSDKEPRSMSGCINVLYMDALWGAGEPTTNLPNGVQTPGTIFDDHEYVKYAIDPDGTKQPSDYISYTCSDSRTNQEDTPVIVGEWSLTTTSNSGQFDPSQNPTFYQQWYGAQMQQYERAAGSCFWTWKTQLGDPRWDLQLAIQQGIVPQNVANYQKNVCP